MQRLAALVYRRRRIVLAAWIAALAVAVAFIFVAGDALTPRQELPGSESVVAGKRLSAEFGIPRTEPIQLVLRGSAPLAGQRAAIEQLVEDTRAAFPGRRIDSPFSSPTGASAIGPSGLVGYINIPFDDQLEAQDSVPAARRVATAQPLPFAVLVSGGPVVQLEQNPALREDLVRAELVAGALSLVVLVVVLGSLVAGVVPLLLALFVIPIVLSIVFALSHVTDVTVFAPNVVTLVGLGIAIDYSLLVVYRFREELHAGREVPDAVAVTMQTAVRAVVFSGVTVGIGLGVLLLVRVPFVQSFGLAGILIPIVTIAAALTLLPALMGDDRPPHRQPPGRARSACSTSRSRGPGAASPSGSCGRRWCSCWSAAPSSSSPRRRCATSRSARRRSPSTPTPARDPRASSCWPPSSGRAASRRCGSWSTGPPPTSSARCRRSRRRPACARPSSSRARPGRW